MKTNYLPTFIKDIQGLKRWGLVTEDAHKLHPKFGFKPLSKPNNLMVIVRDNPS